MCIPMENGYSAVVRLLLRLKRGLCNSIIDKLCCIPLVGSTSTSSSSIILLQLQVLVLRISYSVTSVTVSVIIAMGTAWKV